MFMHGYNGFGWIGMIIGLVFALVLLAGFVVLVVFAVRRMSRPFPHHMYGNGQPMSPMVGGAAAKEIAQARYAKGEITREEYQQIVSDLEK